MDDLLADFLTETNESLAELDVALLALERSPTDAATLSLIFRMVHTIKGTCGFLGLPRLERVAHAGENVLGQLRDGKLLASPDIVSQILTALDRIKAILSGLSQSGAEPGGDDKELIASLNATASGQGAIVPTSSFRHQLPLPRQPAAAEPLRRRRPAVVATARQYASRRQRACAAVAGRPPRPRRRPDRMPEPTAVIDAESADTHPAANDTDGHPAPAAAVQGQTTAAAAAAQTIRVTVDVLEDLMTLVSELVLTRNQLLQLARLEDDSGFTEPLRRLSHITSELQEGIMKTRMRRSAMRGTNCRDWCATSRTTSTRRSS